MKIAIKFSDNDFGNCFRGVLKTLLNAYCHSGEIPKIPDSYFDNLRSCEFIEVTLSFKN